MELKVEFLIIADYQSVMQPAEGGPEGSDDPRPPHPNPELSGEDRFDFSVAHSDINYRHLLVFD